MKKLLIAGIILLFATVSYANGLQWNLKEGTAATCWDVLHDDILYSVSITLFDVDKLIYFDVGLVTSGKGAAPHASLGIDLEVACNNMNWNWHLPESWKLGVFMGRDFLGDVKELYAGIFIGNKF